MEPHSMRSFGIAFFFFHSAEFSGDPSWPFPVPLFPSSLLLTRIPWGGWTCLFDPSSMEEHLGWFRFFWSLQIKLLWTFMYRFLCKCNFSFLRDKCPGMQMLSYTEVAFEIFKKLPNCFPEQWYYDICTSSIWGIQFLHILPSIWSCQYF